jgi:hypothetical protein
VAAAIVAAAVAVTLAVPAMVGDERPAAATLRRMSQVALDQPFQQIERGQYLYVKTQASWLSCVTDVSDPEGAMSCSPDRVRREVWKGPDGSGRLRQSYAERGWDIDERFGPDGLTFVDLTDVPTEVEALRRYVEERAGSEVSSPDVPASSVSPAPSGGGSLGYRMFLVVGDMLHETHAPPALRAALYEVVSTLDGVELIGGTTDQLGRPGIGVGYRDGETLEILVFDPATSVVLGERTELDGEVVGWSAIVDYGVVDSVRTQPGETAG